MGKSRGVLCHLTSLPITNLESAKKFVTLLSKNNIGFWQMLPITPPDSHGSPYASPSAFAGWSELMKKSETAFHDEDSFWLDDWALYCTIKSHHQNLPWTQWPIELRDRDPSALQQWRNKIEFNSELQAQSNFQAAWNDFRNFASEKEVSLIGDLPIFVAHDSADVWAHRELFHLDEDGLPSSVAGVPPDYFSEDGQKWGTVLYDWDAHRKENWQWWKNRFARMLRLFDVVRIDHFRGFHSAWAIPPQDDNAKNGSWQAGPKDELIQVLIKIANSEKQIIAEDLGIIPKEVAEMRIRNNLNGMAVLHFGFDGKLKTNPHHPKNITKQQIVYTGTHDNDTTLGWWNHSDDKRKGRIKQSLKPGEDIVSGCIRLALDCESNLAIIPLQDILRLDSDSRMNTPGTSINNWNWKFSWDNLLSEQLEWYGSL